MKERSIAHHHAETIGKNGDLRVKLYSSDQLGNVWGEEFDSVTIANRVLNRRATGLNLLSSSLFVAGISLPFVLESGIFKRNKLTKALGGLVVVGAEGIIAGWRQGINEMVFETEEKKIALQKAENPKG